MKKLMILLSAFLFILLLSSCQGETSSPTPDTSTSKPLVSADATTESSSSAPVVRQTVKIAVNTHFSGTAARGAELQYNGFAVALKEIEKSGYSLYYDFEVIKNDDENDPSVAASIANKSVYQQGVQVVYGHLNAVQTLAGLAVYDEAGIPCFTPTTSSSVTDYGSDYLFQMGVADNTTAKLLVAYLVEDLGLEKIAVMYSNNEQGYNALASLESKISEYNKTFSCKEEYAMSDIDFAGQILRIKEAGCEAVIVWGGDPAGHNNIATQVRQLIGKDILICGDSQFSTASFLNTASEDIKTGIVCTVAWTATLTDDRSIKFIDDFKLIDSYGSNPSDVSARGYDAMYLLVTALNKMGPHDVNDDGFCDLLAQTIKETTIDGLQGPIAYTEGGACITTAYVVEVAANNALNVVG